MAEDAKARIRSYYDAFNRDPESAIGRYASDEELKQHSRALLGAFPATRSRRKT